MKTVTSIYRAMAIRRINQKLAEYGELSKSSLQDLVFILGNHADRTVKFLESPWPTRSSELQAEFDKALTVEKEVLKELLVLEKEYKLLYKGDQSPIKKIY